MPFPLTEEQQNIVNDRGGELLVSAAAGSGKTRVLVERLLDRVTKEKLDIDRFLVITYTRAAAAELRGRIAQELSDRLALNPNDQHLRRQTTLVYRAQISTIHSFCSVLLRENGHLLDLDPDFRQCNEGEGKILMGQVLEAVLDKRYEELDGDSSFTVLVDTLSAGRDDSRLVQIVTDIYTKVQSYPDPARWLEEQKQLWDLEGIDDLSKTGWGALLLEEARQQVRFCRDRMEYALALAQEDELLLVNYAPSIAATLENLEEFLTIKTWDGAIKVLPISFPDVGRKQKRTLALSPFQEEHIVHVGKRVKDIRLQCKKILEKMAESFTGTTIQQLEEMALSRPAVQALMDLVLDFQTAFSKEKARKGLVDFSDLEHFAVKLLTDSEGKPSPVAQLCSERYNEVLVDEYQDTNHVQNAIFDAISDGGHKLFLVGDVKQSIYRFRLADPTIFREKFNSFSDGETAEKGQPRRWMLTQNFRSRPQVLEGCNDLFRSIMSAEFGELDYDNKQALVPGKNFPFTELDKSAESIGYDPYALELDVLNLAFLGERKGEKESKDLIEARLAAKRIRTLLDQPLMIEGGEGLRP